MVVLWIKQNHRDDFKTKILKLENQGANAARNRGIQAATGSYIAFLDSDDRWLPNKLKKQLKLLNSENEIGGVYCGQQTVNLITGETKPINKRSFPTGVLLEQLLIHDVTEPTSCWVVRKECFDKADMFDENLPARQDWDMWIRLSAHYTIECVPEILVNMGDHTGERIRSDGSREISAHKEIFKKYRYLRNRYAYQLSLAARSAMYRRRGRVYLHNRNARCKAIGLQILAIIVWPFGFDSYAALLGVMLPRRLRSTIHVSWNKVFGKTRLAIRSH